MSISEERLAEIRARLDGRRKMREQAQCDASLHLRSGQEWPCLLPWHKGYHVYDVAIDADRDLADLLAEVERLRGEREDIVSGIYECPANEPQPSVEVLCGWIASDRVDARDHGECPAACELCGERSADQTCEHCNGSGCGPGTALGAYSECEWCAGAGRVHPGCTGLTRTDLLAEVTALRKVATAAGDLIDCDPDTAQLDYLLELEAAVREWRAER